MKSISTLAPKPVAVSISLGNCFGPWAGLSGRTLGLPLPSDLRLKFADLVRQLNTAPGALAQDRWLRLQATTAVTEIIRTERQMA